MQKPTIIPQISEKEIWKTASRCSFVKISSFGNCLIYKDGIWQEPNYFHSGNDYLEFTFENEFYFPHVEVCEAFHGERPEGMVPDHIDDCRENNYFLNLRWVTRSENAKKAAKNRKLFTPGPVAVVRLDKKTEMFLDVHPSMTEAANVVGCAMAGIGAALSDKRPRYTHYGGYKWMRLTDYLTKMQAEI